MSRAALLTLYGAMRRCVSTPAIDDTATTAPPPVTSAVLPSRALPPSDAMATPLADRRGSPVYVSVFIYCRGRRTTSDTGRRGGVLAMTMSPTLVERVKARAAAERDRRSH